MSDTHRLGGKRATLDRVSVVVPCFNEEAVIKLFHQRLIAVLSSHFGLGYEVIYVDDGSKDSTWMILRSLALNDERIRVVRLSRNFGHQNALIAGLSHAVGNPVISIDSDLQDPPELIPALVDEWQKGSKVVSAQRNERQGETWFKRSSAALYYRLLNQISNVPITVDCGDFRLMDAEVVSELYGAAEADPYIRGLIGWLGFQECVIRYDRDRRASGSTKYTLFRMLALAKQGLMNSSSLAPKVPGLFAIVAVVGFCAALATKSKTVAGFWGTVFANSVLFSVLGQYMESILRLSGNKPAFVVSEVFSVSNTLLAPIGVGAQTELGDSV
ncbi:glycosyltransferase family 2 protein (plasmid) [Pseudarthrobacter sp. O4]|uniref:glycosyltransferase family 2 protein n=1 Tax=Pseudarthrobacter sp. O4 TaxID=3418417 RepID=UPI003CFAD4D2